MGEDRSGADKECAAGSKKRQLEGPSEVRLTNDLFFFLTELIVILVGVTLSILIWLKDLWKKPKSLKGRVCLVTGAGRGLGRELCLALAKEGAILACADINSANNEETVRLVQAAGSKAKAYTVDTAVKKKVEETIAKAEEELGPIYLLVNNAALIMPMSEPNEEYIRALFNVNLLGYIWATEAVLPGMISRKEGHVLNVSSYSAFSGVISLRYYGASKAAVTNYAQAVRYELLKDYPNTNIYITVIYPIVMNTSKDYTSLTNNRTPYAITTVENLRSEEKVLEADEDETVKRLMDIELSARTPVMDAKEVARTAINGVKYNEEDVIIPRAWTLAAKLMWFLPTCLKVAGMKSSLSTKKPPSAKDLQGTDVGDIISSSSLIKQDKENLKLS